MQEVFDVALHSSAWLVEHRISTPAGALTQQRRVGFATYRNIFLTSPSTELVLDMPSDGEKAVSKKKNTAQIEGDLYKEKEIVVNYNLAYLSIDTYI